MIWAWIGALAVGLTLGILGSGGSILTVPVLVYLVGEPEKVAIAESLGIVGAISLSGFIPYAIKKQVHWPSIFYFGVPGIAGTYFGSVMAAYVSGEFQLIVFAFIMLIAAIMMFRQKAREPKPVSQYNLVKWQLGLQGFGVGSLTGFIGVGGGFMIVPALVLLAGLPISLSVGTSLAIISLNSFSGFYKHLDVLKSFDLTLNWSLIIIFSLIGAVGSLIGNRVGVYIPQEKLKKSFASFLVVMAAYIIFMNL
ncbi:sulfite exporter TauE/SafE family protein [Balneolaceae bacterium YR4-1]|uniref:Probable membrane transporter protein n=1 Tax=Halalkalibaculum roseum TaxID=2709311 RepID=A0A6M1SLC3_9BACT|nr:sulfite exporter TauE/SafE family protein [Halalkalibaculum roseum]NGP75799.1 sulfite exporter TauE/SafE family protein [Halalkalibaculum roseum]